MIPLKSPIGFTPPGEPTNLNLYYIKTPKVLPTTSKTAYNV